MVTCEPLGSALVTQSLRAITPPAPGLFRTSREGCPGRKRTRLRPSILPYRSGLSPAPNPTVMVTEEIVASCAAARAITPAHAELARIAEKIPKEAKRYRIVPSLAFFFFRPNFFHWWSIGKCFTPSGLRIARFQTTYYSQKSRNRPAATADFLGA